MTETSGGGRSGSGGRLTSLLAMTAGLGAANIYYAQPMIGLIGADFRVDGAAAAQASTAAQVGYLLGILFVVPLGDIYDRRSIILVLTVALIVALLAAAVSPTLICLIVASLAVGISATLAQQAVPLAANLADPATAGRSVGRVLSGLLAGILFARTLSGLVAEHFGWRAMYGLGAVIGAALFGLALVGLPRSHPTPSTSYADLLTSVMTLFRRHGVLRRAAVVQGALFAGFSAFWTVLALHLQHSSFDLGPAAAGLFGLLGLTGVLIAPLVGRTVDRIGAFRVTTAGIVFMLLGWLATGIVPGLVGLVLAVILMDAGVQISLVSNQAAVFALDPAARSRLNTVFVAGIFLGGALGSACGSAAWALAGWNGVLLAGAGFAGLGLIVHRSGRRAIADA